MGELATLLRTGPTAIMGWPLPSQSEAAVYFHPVMSFLSNVPAVFSTAGNSFSNHRRDRGSLLNFYFFLGICLMASSCASIKPGAPWPDGAPPSKNFVHHYQMDKKNQRVQTKREYLHWVRRFYLGINLVPGWLKITDQVLGSLEEPRRSHVAEQLRHVGERIGSEWAKDNDVRLISTRSAVIWGQAVPEALNQDDLDNFLVLLDGDVEAMLTGKISGSDIGFERYYAYDFDSF